MATKKTEKTFFLKSSTKDGFTYILSNGSTLFFKDKNFPGDAKIIEKPIQQVLF